MNQIQIESFISSVKNGSFSGAAKELYLSTQVVSQHIQNLEAELDTPLFIRKKNGVALTDKGREFFSFATEWASLYQDVLRNIKETYQGMSSSLTLGLSEYVDYTGEIIDGILSFTASHDNVEVKGSHYKSGALLAEIYSGELDVAIIPDSQIVSSGDYGVLPFAKEQLHLYISAKVKNPKKVTLGSRELDNLCAALPQLNTSYGVWNSKEWIEVSNRMSMSQGYQCKCYYEMPNFRSVITGLQHMPAVAVCDIRFGYKVDPAVFHLPLKVESYLCCVWNKRNENTLIKEFVDHMVAFYKEET